ncbi:PA2169 family four-helix-bundle protein [Paradesertivirga mongoliensis]|uniref:PA2169 family four-helix-bundle protein n=1 Tax=Paradesertivirga mongoliensis TaxID=2100740 RepID=A0ABW4ZPR8_9SPHI|nr:PA2169 family four-helix-bundle protein [Pedobacter mongoliensis]
METRNEDLIDGIKHLLHIANDGKEGYKTAAEDADSAELKALFTTYSIQRSEFEMELKSLLRQLGADSDNESGGPLGAIHRVWMDIKTAVTGNDNHAILDACITGEKAAIEAYDKVLADTSLTPEMRETLTSQRSDINECLRNVQSLEQQYS